MHLDPAGAVNHATPINGACMLTFAFLPFDHIDVALRKPQTGFIQANVARAFGRGLRQLADHDQFGQWRQTRGLPGGGLIAQNVELLRGKVKR